MMTIISHKQPFYAVALLCLLCLGNFSYAKNHGSDDADKSWQFKVFLDGEEIGFHNFAMTHKGDQKVIHTNARFDVKFLFFTAYSYQHDNVEQWRGQCLETINAVTNDNGDEFKVSGKIDSDLFIVNTIEKENAYPSCIKTFAYWDPAFLKESMLLNSQTGEMNKVESEFIANETLVHDGKAMSARRYRLSGDKLQIDVWYSDEDLWLALESLTENGRVVRYSMP